MSVKLLRLKSVIRVPVGLLSFVIGGQAFANDCQDLSGCERKFCEIESQIQIAKDEGNPFKLSGLNKALKEAKTHCSDDQLQQELTNEIDELNRDIAEYQADLEDAKAKGKLDKVSKYQRKIEEKRQELKLRQQELQRFS
ncbi:hypothetical protein VPR01S_07_01780 [Vibrio proteolyticus NBRC 13287]|uniref:DUF1090 domain-containing protein n=1 Tax=Vibrio proteolyticus NBRC 13287 TaxID=1219065 RepID=U3BL93_VIBPR|nr:hypothetical protein VPR01S_07_01780 [Vibrio proteolyticus NBRC 13287]